MSEGRFVVLGLARSRSTWLRSVARWATSGAAPIELSMCVSTAELAVRLGEGRPRSAVLLDGSLPGVDRDLVDLAVRSSATVIVVDDQPARDWRALGAAAVLATTFRREALLDLLAEHARPVPLAQRGAAGPAEPERAPVGLRASVATVCGPGGTGASTVAAALGQGLARGPRLGPVLVADLALHADQAMLHDVGDVAPGIQELVEAHRSGTPDEGAVRSVAFDLPDRGYHLLLGLRRARQWSTVRVRAFEAAFESLCRSYEVVVCDTDRDLEDAPAFGDQADRCLFARTATGAADVAFVVGRPGLKGLHALAGVVGDLVEAGVPASRVVPVVVGAPRSPVGRSALVQTVVELTAVTGEPLAPALLLPSRRVDEAARDGLPAPAPLPALLAGAFTAVMGRLGPRDRQRAQPELVAPGSLGLA